MTWKTSFSVFNAQHSLHLNQGDYSNMILNLWGKTSEQEEDWKIGNDHLKVETEIYTALSITDEHTVEDMPMAVEYYVFIASSLFSSCIHSITGILLLVALPMAHLNASLLQSNGITIIPLKITIYKENIKFPKSFKR